MRHGVVAPTPSNVLGLSSSSNHSGHHSQNSNGLLLPQPKMKMIYYPRQKDLKSLVSKRMALGMAAAFLFGCLFTASVILNIQIHQNSSVSSLATAAGGNHHPLQQMIDASNIQCQQQLLQKNQKTLVNRRQQVAVGNDGAISSNNNKISSILQNLKILVVIVAFDFSQIPHLEEVLSTYHDVCVAGAMVDVIIHATIAYPVTLLDLWNTRFLCEHFQITITLKPKSLRLHLVDEHRKVFYQNLHEYDLFIYQEDDIRTTPTTIATYWSETRRIEHILGNHTTRTTTSAKPSDFNVGIVRYEYNYPANVIIDDKTRHATQNVTRVYWEHSGFQRPVVPNAVHSIPEQHHPALTERYVTMQNHHQGMFLATRQLLMDWKDRPKCDFATIRNRPGSVSQPTEGTQRVWMSSQMLYGGRHCNVQQVLPKDKFGALTVLHLPNKNYRRVGKYRNRTFSDGTEVFEKPHESLLTAMELHIAIRAAWPATPQYPYKGIRMVDEVNRAKDRSPLLERRMREYDEYVKRGGVLSEQDMTKIDLVEEE